MKNQKFVVFSACNNSDYDPSVIVDFSFGKDAGEACTRAERLGDRQAEAVYSPADLRQLADDLERITIKQIRQDLRKG